MPNHPRARLYQVRTTPTATPIYLTLENGVLTVHHHWGEWTRYERPGTWLTRAWERFRGRIF